MTLANGAPGAARPGQGEGPPRAGQGTPQSGIPTQGAPGHPGPMPPRPSGPFSAPPGSVPPPRPRPGGAPAQRSPLVESPPAPDDDRTSLVERSEPSAADWWQKAREALARRGPTRWGLLGALTVVQAFVLFSAVMWWVGSSAPSASATMAPITWTGIVYDVGAAGVNLRAAPQVRADDARDTAARGARLALSCGETGDVVDKGPVKTATWLRTTDGLFVSMLYVRVAGHTSIPSCNGSKVDGPLLALADPANPQLPPPPGTQISGESGTPPAAPGTSVDASATAAHSGGSGVVGGGQGTALAGPRSPLDVVPPAGPSVPTAPVAQGAPSVAPSIPIGTGTGHKHRHDNPPGTPGGAPAGPTAVPAATPNPDTTPVG